MSQNPHQPRWASPQQEPDNGGPQPRKRKIGKIVGFWFLGAFALFIVLGIIGSATGAGKSKTASDSKPTGLHTSQSAAAGPVGYLYDVDEHRRSRADVEGLVQNLRSRCTDDALVLESTATNTALDLVDAEHAQQDVYRVLAQLVSGLPASGGKVQCASRLPGVAKDIKAKRAASASPSATPTPTHSRSVTTTATRQPAPVQTTHHTTAPPVDDHGGATALCDDGTLSYSQHHQGTCSHHHGVAVWYK